METYNARIILNVTVEAPNVEDAMEMIDDHFGLGSCGEGVTVDNIELVTI